LPTEKSVATVTGSEIPKKIAIAHRIWAFIIYNEVMGIKNGNKENTAASSDLPALGTEEISFADQSLSSKKAFAIVGIIVGVFIFALFSLSSSRESSYLKNFDFSKNPSPPHSSEQEQVAGGMSYELPGRPSPTPTAAEQTPEQTPTPTPTPTPQPDKHSENNNPEPTHTPILPTPTSEDMPTPTPTPEENNTHSD
jgi:outer membrane biosynthesis protein TonB